MGNITLKPSFVVKIYRLFCLVAIALLVALFFDEYSKPDKVYAGQNFLRFFIVFSSIYLPFFTFNRSWSIELNSKGITLTNDFFLCKIIKKTIEYEVIEKISIDGILNKYLAMTYSARQKFYIYEETTLVQGAISELEFKDTALFGSYRFLHRLKYEIEKRANIENDDPYLPYSKP